MTQITAEQALEAIAVARTIAFMGKADFEKTLKSFEEIAHGRYSRMKQMVGAYTASTLHGNLYTDAYAALDSQQVSKQLVEFYHHYDTAFNQAVGVFLRQSMSPEPFLGDKENIIGDLESHRNDVNAPFIDAIIGLIRDPLKAALAEGEMAHDRAGELIAEARTSQKSR